MRDTSRHLSQTLDLLHLLNLRESRFPLAGALFNPLFEIGISLGKLSRALGNAVLQFGIQPF